MGRYILHKVFVNVPFLFLVIVLVSIKGSLLFPALSQLPSINTCIFSHVSALLLRSATEALKPAPAATAFGDEEALRAG